MLLQGQPNQNAPIQVQAPELLTSASSADQTPKTILLVDDDENSPLLLTLALKKLHPPPTLHFVSNAILAQEYLLGTGAFADRLVHPFPQLILLDLSMPMMNGFEFLSWARSLPEFKPLPIVVLTDSINPRDLSRAYELGATLFLVKPADMAELAEPLKNLLQLRC